MVSDRILAKFALRIMGKMQDAEFERRMDGSKCPFKMLRVLDEMHIEANKIAQSVGLDRKSEEGVAFQALLKEVAAEIAAEQNNTAQNRFVDTENLT